MPTSADTTGLILAGGQSRRFGQDKALAELGGVSFVALVYAALAAHADTVLIATGPTPRPYPVSARVVLDPVAGGGPVTGLAAGLNAAATSWLLTAAVDLPYLTPSALCPLAAARLGSADVFVAHADGHRQPTCALWRVQAVTPVVRELIRETFGTRGPSLRYLLSQLVVQEVTLESGSLRNVNRSGDLT